MSAQSNIARPYAQALFELAQEQDDLAGWDEQLRLLAMVMGDAAVLDLASNPHVPADQLIALVLDVGGDRLGPEGKNLVRLLVKNGRVADMADIAEAYAERKAEAERVITARVITTAAMGDGQREQFARALQEKLGRRVDLEFEVDEALIGGAVIRAGDWVVDGSVKAQLEQLVGAIGS